MRFWQWILKWLTIRDHKDMKAIERAISFMSKLLPVLQGLIVGTWTWAIAFEISLTIYLWIEIAIAVFVGVGVVGLRSRVAAQRDKANDESEGEIASEQKKISEERKRRRIVAAKSRQEYDLNNRRRYVENRLFVPEPYRPEQWSNTDTIDIWNARIEELQDSQRTTRRQAEAIESQGRALVRSAIVLYIALSIIFTITWTFKWHAPKPDTPVPCCPEVKVNYLPPPMFSDTCCTGVNIKLGKLFDYLKEVELKPKLNTRATISVGAVKLKPEQVCSNIDLCKSIDDLNARLDSILRSTPPSPVIPTN